MAATSIFFNGRLIRNPGSYSEVDTSGLNAPALGSTGIVAVLATGEGGRPMNTITNVSDLVKFTTQQQMVKAYRDGDLQDVADMLFSPSKDTAVPGGAAQVISCKVNPATQSTGVLQRSGTDVMTLASKDYGAFTAQINVSIASGTNKGKLITIKFESTTETKDDLGGDAMFVLQYVATALGYQTAVAAVNDAGDITVTATRFGLGQSNLVTTNLAAPGAIEVLSSNAGDTTQTVTVYGLDATGNVAQKATVTLNGTTVVPVTGTWGTGGVLGLALSAAALGTVTVRAAGAGAVIFDVPAATISEGLIRVEDGYVSAGSGGLGNTLSLVSDGALTSKVAVFGKQASGSDQQTVATMNGLVPVVPVTLFTRVDVIAVGAVTNTRLVTMTVEAAKTVATVQKTLQKVKDYFDARKRVIAGPTTVGFVFTFGTGNTAMSVADLDIVTPAANILTARNFTADVALIASWINANSNLITATVAANAPGTPDNTSSPIFLTGGGEGTTLFSHWQAALNLLKQTRVNTVVVLTGDPAVHAALDAHIAFCCGIGRSERDGKVGLLNAGLTDVPSKTEIKAQIINLNTRHLVAWAQTVDRFDAAGERKTFLPMFGAAILAGMQAGGPVGMPSTHKVLNCLDINQSATWNPTDDVEEMLEAGLCFGEKIEGIGRRVVRGITTHLSTSNIAFVEASVNQSVNLSVFEFRSHMEFAVGRPQFRGTITAIRSEANAKLGLLTREEFIAAYRGLSVSIALDVAEVGVEMAPIIPINFVKNTIHLTTLQQIAAGAQR